MLDEDNHDFIWGNLLITGECACRLRHPKIATVGTKFTWTFLRPTLTLAP